jgi:hypothetical protein
VRILFAQPFLVGNHRIIRNGDDSNDRPQLNQAVRKAGYFKLQGVRQTRSVAVQTCGKRAGDFNDFTLMAIRFGSSASVLRVLELPNGYA